MATNDGNDPIASVSEMTPGYTAGNQAQNDVPNRGNDTKQEIGDEANIVITLEKINTTIREYIEQTIKPTITDNGTVRLVPVVYGTPERWTAFRRDGVLRQPNSDKLLTPMIMFKQGSVSRGKLTNPVNKNLEISWEAGWNRRNVYDRFAVVNGIKPSRELHAVMVPDYVDIEYEVVLWTEYESQMSELIGAFEVENDDYWGPRNDFKFRIKIDGFQSQSDIDVNKDRIIRSMFIMNVSAYLIPEKAVMQYRQAQTNRKYYTTKRKVTILETE